MNRANNPFLHQNHHPHHRRGEPLRSRAIWDETRKRDAPRTALLRAILYELQPVRFSTLDLGGFRTFAEETKRFIEHFFVRVLPQVGIEIRRFLGRLSWREWMYVGCAVAYWQLVRYLHRVLDAGPMVLILSALIAIFTIGLDDGENTNGGGPSAYSVFNRGFQTILGSIDVENLVAQHVGGGAVGVGAGLAMRDAREWQGEEEWEEEQVDGDGVDGRRRRGALGGNAGEPQGLDAGVQQERQPHGNRARKSGKKARRRNLEARRGIQRQRQAAADMGFVGGNGINNAGLEEEAMNRLVEEQAAAAAAFGGLREGDNRDDANLNLNDDDLAVFQAAAWED